MELAVQFLLILLAMLFAGAWVDSTFHTGPWGTLGGFALGFVMSMGSVYKQSLAAQKNFKHGIKPLPPEPDEDDASKDDDKDWP